MVNARFSRLARLDLIEIADYTADRWGPAQAERYLNELNNCFHRLVDNPRLGRPSDQIRPGYRRAEHRSHVVFYRVADEGGVFICRILHKSMLPEMQLFDEP